MFTCVMCNKVLNPFRFFYFNRVGAGRYRCYHCDRSLYLRHAGISEDELEGRAYMRLIFYCIVSIPPITIWLTYFLLRINVN